MEFRISTLCAAALSGLAALVAAPAAQADTSNCKVITTLPYVAAAPGHYCLASNLVHAGTGPQAIRINASDVVLDCNGYSIDQTGTPATAGVYLTGRADVVIRNCTLRNFERGLFVLGGAPRSRRIELIGNTIVGARLVGIQAELRDGVVLDNRIIDTTGSRAVRLTADGEGLLLFEGNAIRGVTGAGAAAYGLTIEGAGRAVVAANSIAAVGTSANTTAYGVRILTAASVAPSPAIIEDNTLSAPGGLSNVPLSRASTTARSRCVGNTIVGVKNAAQWGASTACL